MVVGVVELAVAARDDAPRAAVLDAGRRAPCIRGSSRGRGAAAGARNCRRRRRRARTGNGPPSRIERSVCCASGGSSASATAATAAGCVRGAAPAPAQAPPARCASSREQRRRAAAREAAAAAPCARRSGLLRLPALPQPDVQLAQLLLVDGVRRVREQILRALRLRERDHVADRLRARHQRRPCGRGRTRCRRAAARRTAAPRSRKPNFACASSAPMLSARNTFDCTSWRWIRIEPPPISQPFSTMSCALARARAGIGFEQVFVPVGGRR